MSTASSPQPRARKPRKIPRAQETPAESGQPGLFTEQDLDDYLADFKPMSVADAFQAVLTWPGIAPLRRSRRVRSNLPGLAIDAMNIRRYFDAANEQLAAAVEAEELAEQGMRSKKAGAQ